MGSLVGSYCYQSSAEALDGYYSAKEPSFTAGSTSYLSYFEKVAGVWTIVRKSIASNGNVTSLTSSTAPAVEFPACDPAGNFLDGMTIGWAIAAAMVSVYAIKFLWQAK